MGSVGAASLARAQTRRPNILMIMADQFRADCLGADGNPHIRTPNLDRLAREGVRFRAAYSTTPTCTPARAALLTGMAPWNHGMLGYSRVAEKYPVEMPRLLAAAGYHTGVIGKCHYAPQRNLHGFHWGLLDESGRSESIDFRSDYRAWFLSEAPNLNPDATGLTFNDYRGAPYVLPERLHPTTWTADCAVRFLASYQKPEPFFLKVSFARPHSPYDPPTKWWRKYEDAPLPKARVGDWCAKYAPRSDDTPNIWHGDMGEATIRKSRQGYYGAVSYIDEQIGRILEALEKRGWLDETLVLFFSDHGDMTGDHHLWRKSYAYEASARIPMLLRGPGAQGGVVRNEPVEIRDVLPTLLDAAGAERPAAVDGRSMLGLLRGDPWRKWIDLEHDVCYSPANHWTALTDGRTKYIFHASDGSEQLFDLAHDPHEMKDLAGSNAHEATLREWRGRMIAHLEPRGERFVRNGRLQVRATSDLLSPNYPKSTPRR